MAEIRIEYATKHHARELGRIMRSADRLEIRASGNFDPEKGVRASINRACEAYALYVGDDLLAVFGVTDTKNGWFVPWALTSTHVDRYPKAFFAVSRRAVACFQVRYTSMVQMVHARYSQSIGWLENLGFQIEAPVKFGVSNELFCRVSMHTPKLEA